MKTRAIDKGTAKVDFKVDFKKYPLLANKTIMMNFSATVDKHKISKMISVTFFR